MAILARTSMRKRNYLPPAYKWLWKLHICVPPPHFLKFYAALLITGAPFGVCALGLAMASTKAPAPLELGAALLVATLLFGVAIAIYYRAGRIRYKLPKWEDL